MPDPSLGSVAAVAEALHVPDLLVFELRTGAAALVGGSGRGAGWAGIVEVTDADEPRLREVAERRRTIRIVGDAPSRIIGPYWATHAALVPVGEHLVVVGSPEPIRASAGELARFATEAVALAGDIPSSKLLADELELVQAVQQLNDYSASSMADAARHAAGVAAEALSCEIGAILLNRDGQTEVHGAGSAWATMADDPVLCAALHRLAGRASVAPIIEQDLDTVGDSGLRVVSCYALGIGRDGGMGALIVGHTDARPRGFTTLCRRVGRALADATESLLLMAIAREELEAQRDRFAREARTDPLTGLANRIQWEEELATQEARWQRYGHPIVLVSMDVNDLKATNDRHGHAVGDELLRGAAEVLRAVIRSSDVLARIGGDEFAAMLLESDAEGAASLKARVTEACAARSTADGAPPVSLAIGWAVPEPGEMLRAAFARADRAMYEQKRGPVPVAHD